MLVYKPPRPADWTLAGEVTEDGRYLVINVRDGHQPPQNRIIYKDLTEPYGLPVDLIEDFDNEYSFVGNDGPIFYFKTDYKAPRGRLIAIDTRKPDR